MHLPLDQTKIQELIPHRYPFLFVDGVSAYEPGKSIDGYKMVSVNEPFFQGHFPGKPVTPGVIITEAMAQLACIFMRLELGEAGNDKTPLFLGIDKARFRSMVVPGMRLDLRMEVLSCRGNILKAKAAAKVGDGLAAEAELTCMLK